MSKKSTDRSRSKSTAVFFPFDLFGSGGTAKGAELLADACREMLADNRRERKPTRSRSYTDNLRIQELALANLSACQQWRTRARRAVRGVFGRNEFLLWVTGNHLGVLPVYEEIGGSESGAVVIQLDAHLDIYHLSDCTRELSHGNFLLHAAAPLPPIINVGSRELLLTPDYTSRYYQQVFTAAELAVDANSVIGKIRESCRAASSVFLDIDCDVFDPAAFPAVAQPMPFGLDASLFLRIVDAAWSDKVIGVALSEFDPGRDQNDRCLATLVWLVEYLMLKRYEP